MGYGLRYLGHRCPPESAIKPWYFLAELELTTGSTIPVPPGGLTLGRGANAGVRVASNGIARAHALVREVDGRLVATDLGTTNGTRVNGADITERTVEVGDTLTLAFYFDFEIVAMP